MDELQQLIANLNNDEPSETYTRPRTKEQKNKDDKPQQQGVAVSHRLGLRQIARKAASTGPSPMATERTFVPFFSSVTFAVAVITLPLLMT